MAYVYYDPTETNKIVQISMIELPPEEREGLSEAKVADSNARPFANGTMSIKGYSLLRNYSEDGFDYEITKSKSTEIIAALSATLNRVPEKSGGHIKIVRNTKTKIVTVTTTEDEIRAYNREIWLFFTAPFDAHELLHTYVLNLDDLQESKKIAFKLNEDRPMSIYIGQLIAMSYTEETE